jgi:uncharacterized protein YqgV (UPF0045/DUF77 family)
MHISPAIEKAAKILRDANLPITVGSMSSVTYGNSKKVFRAFQMIYDTLAADYHIVMMLTLSNACPVPMKTVGSRKDGDDNP